MEKVVIIGAGPAGLTAAYELLKNKEKNFDVVILEETNNIGGISKTVKYNKNRMDIGGHRFFTKDERVVKLWKEIMPVQGKPSVDDKILERKKILEKGGPDPEIDDNVMLIRTRVSRIYYSKKFFDYPISIKIKTFKNMGFLKTIKVIISYVKSIVIKRKENSLEDFYINRFGKTLYSMFFERYTEKLWGRHPSEIAADWGEQRVKGVSIKAIIKDMLLQVFKIKNNTNAETSLIEQFWYPKFGPGQLWENLAKKDIEMGARLLSGCKVEKINVRNGKISSIIYKKNGKLEEIEGDIFISSMPLKDLVLGIRYDSQEIKEIAEKLPYRDFITVGLYLNRLKLKNETNIKTLGNIIPDCWIYVQEPDVKIGRIQIFNNWSPYLVEDVKNKVGIGLEYFCTEGDEYWKMSETEFTEFAISELVKMNIIDKEDVIDSHVEKVKKAYPAYFDTYKYIDKIINYVDSFGNLYCIGRNGQHRYNNMDHSMLTAIEAVNNIRNGTKSKQNIWNVNTEKTYHEKRQTNDKSIFNKKQIKK